MATVKGIPQGVLDEIRERADIVAVVSDHVLLKRAGANFSGLCPFHSEKTPSFTVHPGKRIFHCFGCGVGGDVFSFVMRIQNISFPAAIEKLAMQVGLDLTPYRGRESDVDFARIHNLMREAQGFFKRALAAAPAARAYLEKRGLTAQTIREFGIGYAPDEWRAATDHLTSRGYTRDELVTFGLVRRGKEDSVYDYFRGRVVFPIEDEFAKPVGFGGRILGDGNPKYLNSPESAVYSKGRMLFNLHRAAPAAAEAGMTLLLVEGYMDVIGLWQAGFHHVVATLGTALTETQVRKLAKVAKHLVFAYDPDAAGVKATLRALPLLEKTGLEVSMLRLPQGVDPDEFVQENGADALQERLHQGQPVEQFLFEATRDRHPNWKSPEGKRLAMRDMIEVFGLLPSVLSQQAFVERVADCFEIGEELVRKALMGQGDRAAAPVDATPTRPHAISPLVQAERTLIYCFLTDFATYRKVSSDMRISEFRDPYCKKLLQILAEIDQEAGPVTSLLLDTCEDEELRRFITAELMVRPTVDEAGVEAMLDDCLRELKKHRLEARKRELQRQVSSSGASDAALLREFKQVTEDLQSLLKGPGAPAASAPRAG
ncbi:MAG: DNA primase [Candidatus Riflebacteria bacterium]|nr:DNA primase [Candidatus Riflebacteria bacterium]